MKHCLTKILSLLFIVAFLATNTGSLYGCISCDSGSLSEAHIKSHLDDHSDHHVDIHDGKQPDVHINVTIGNQLVSLDQHPDHQNDRCVDSRIQPENGILENSEDFKASVMLAVLQSQCDFTNVPSNNTANKPIQLSSLRIPQTILFHRTIVLLS